MTRPLSRRSCVRRQARAQRRPARKRHRRSAMERASSRFPPCGRVPLRSSLTGRRRFALPAGCTVDGVAALPSYVLIASAVAAFGAAPVRTWVGPTRLVSPGFGYSVAYRAVESGTTVHSAIGLYLYDHGRWRDVTPPTLRADGIDG